MNVKSCRICGNEKFGKIEASSTDGYTSLIGSGKDVGRSGSVELNVCLICGHVYCFEMIKDD